MSIVKFKPAFTSTENNLPVFLRFDFLSDENIPTAFSLKLQARKRIL